MKKTGLAAKLLLTFAAFITGKLGPTQNYSNSVWDDEDDWASLERNQLENSSVVYFTHPKAQCLGEFCTIHNRSNHVMRAFPQHWRADRMIIERICPHGIGHPDPDEYRVLIGEDDGVHGCDGCCAA